MSRPVLSILYLIENCGHGGAEAQVAMQASCVSALGHRVTVGVPGSGWLTEELARRGITVQPLSVRRGKLAAAHWAREIARIVRARDIDIIHAHLLQMNLGGALAGRLTGVPVVATVHGQVYDFERRRRLLAYRLIARSGVTITTPSLHLREALVQSARVPGERVIAIHNGIDLDALQAALPARDLPGGFRVGAVGRLDPVKGLEHLLDAAAAIGPQAPDLRFIIAGEGPQRASLERRIGALGLDHRVTLLGHRDDVPALMQALDIFVLPSLSEGLPTALLEAMAAARPIVASDIPGIAEVVRHRHSALLTPPGDAQALGDAILELRRDPQLAADLGRAARERVQAHFSLAQCVAQYVELYCTLLENRGSARVAGAAAGRER